MKKNIIIVIITIIIVLLVLSSLIVFAGNDKQQLSLNDKVSEEIEYLDKYIVSLLGDFNGLTIGSYLKEKKSSNIQMESQQSEQSESKQSNSGTDESENSEDKTKETKDNSKQNGKNKNVTISGILENRSKENTEWDTISNQIEELYSIWNTISIDLHSLKVDGKLILNFSDYLNESTQNIKKRDKQKAMESSIKLYQLLPQYYESFNPDSQRTNILKIQSNIVTSYVYVSNERWQDAQKESQEALSKFSTLLNSVNQNFHNQSTANQCYILINELNKAIQLKDKEIFYIQYQNLMEKIEILKD